MTLRLMNHQCAAITELNEFLDSLIFQQTIAEKFGISVDDVFYHARIHPAQDRCWVPWIWCNIEKTQRKNNSIVIFSPDNSTRHGLKTHYDYLNSQSTQLYENFWYHSHPAKIGPGSEYSMIETEAKTPDFSQRYRLKSVVSSQVRLYRC